MRIEVLTFLRFVAAAIVVFFHYLHDPALHKPAILTAGSEMVTFFYVLSGFVLTVSRWDRPVESVWRYYYARLARIAPVYWAAVIWSTLVVVPYVGTDVALNATFLQSWFPLRALGLNPPGWSISNEVFFYAIFPLLFLAARSPTIPTRQLFAAGLAAWAMSQAVSIYLLNALALKPFLTLSHALVYYFPLPHTCSFLLGVATGALFKRTPLPTTAPAQRRIGILATLALALVYLNLAHREWLAVFGLALPSAASLFAPLFAVAVYFVACSTGPVARFFSRAPFVVLGEASYALYIFQHPAQITYTKLFNPTGGFKMTIGPFLMYFACLLAVSIASVYLFEKPVRRALMAILRPPAFNRTAPKA